MKHRRQELTPRQIAVLRLAAEGLGHAEIGDRLRIKQRSVEDLVKRAKKQLGARNTTHACIIAVRSKLFR